MATAKRSKFLIAASIGTAAFMLAACSSSDNAAETSPESSTPAASESAAPAASEATIGGKVAYLSASSANTWLQSSLVAMKDIATPAGIELVEFDAQFKPGEAAKQIQDVLASGEYEGIIISGLDGSALIPDLQQAIDAGLPVVILNQIIGDALDTSDPQFDGPAASVLVPPKASGTLLGELVVEACADIDPCNVGYFFGIKGSPLDTALRLGFDEAIAGSPNVLVVEEAESQYLGPDVALKATQDMLQKNPNLNVISGPDQAIQGAELAVEDAGLSGKIKLIGFGGSQAALDGISSGKWFGDVFGAPATEGALAMKAMIAALTDGTSTGGVNPLLTFPNGGKVTSANVSDYTAEWVG
jgi:ribose transport system substrate-binding protein